VASTPAIGLTRAAIGTWVSSAPEIRSGDQTLVIATTSQMTEIATVKAAHDERPTSGVLRLNAMSTSPVAITA
jgi:hypothetical protein